MVTGEDLFSSQMDENIFNAKWTLLQRGICAWCTLLLQMVSASHSLHYAVLLTVLYWPPCHRPPNGKCKSLFTLCCVADCVALAAVPWLWTYGMTSPCVCGAVSISFYNNFTYVALDQIIACIVLAAVPSLGICCDLACVCRTISYS